MHCPIFIQPSKRLFKFHLLSIKSIHNNPRDIPISLIRNSNTVKKSRILETYFPNTKRQCTLSNTSHYWSELIYGTTNLRDAFNEDVSKQLEGKVNKNKSLVSILVPNRLFLICIHNDAKFIGVANFRPNLQAPRLVEYVTLMNFNIYWIYSK